MSTDILKELEYPYFRQRVVKIGKYQENVSEDATFCLDVKTKMMENSLCAWNCPHCKIGTADL